MTTNAMIFDLTKETKKLRVIYAAGFISEGDRDELERILSQSSKKNILILNSYGGLVTEMYDLINLVTSAQFDVHLGIAQDCASACVPFFASVPIKRRFMFSDSQIGIHAVHLNLTGSITIIHKAETQKIVDFLKDKISFEWLEKNKQYFFKKEITYFSADELMRDSAGFVLKNRIYPAISDDYTLDHFIKDFKK